MKKIQPKSSFSPPRAKQKRHCSTSYKNINFKEVKPNDPNDPTKYYVSRHKSPNFYFFTLSKKYDSSSTHSSQVLCVEQYFVPKFVRYLYYQWILLSEPDIGTDLAHYYNALSSYVVLFPIFDRSIAHCYQDFFFTKITSLA